MKNRVPVYSLMFFPVIGALTDSASAVLYRTNSNFTELEVKPSLKKIKKIQSEQNLQTSPEEYYNFLRYLEGSIFSYLHLTAGDWQNISRNLNQLDAIDTYPDEQNGNH